VLVGFAFVVSLSACGGSSIDTHRLAVLSQDPLATAQAPDTTPWIPAVDTPEHIRRNGTAGRISFGEPSPTSVQVRRHLQGSPSVALRFYAETAIRSGWRVVPTIQCYAEGSATFVAGKQFAGWVATAVVGTLTIHGAPAVTIDITTDYHGRATETVLPETAYKPLTVQGLASTCISGSIPGHFYPVLDQTDTTTLVMLSGLKVRLSDGLTKTIGGLGAISFGSVSPRDSTVCCPVNFEVDHGAPSDLFNTLGPHAITTPVLVSAAQAKQEDLRQGVGSYAILSTGDWTLVETSSADPAILKRLHGWRLRSTPYGAVLVVPADSAIDHSGVLFGRTPDLSDRQVELTENSCAASADARRTFTSSAAGETVGYWCVQGLRVRIEGPRSYVESVIADLKVNVRPNA
jgi:hypothetical protein